MATKATLINEPFTLKDNRTKKLFGYWYEKAIKAYHQTVLRGHPICHPGPTIYILEDPNLYAESRGGQHVLYMAHRSPQGVMVRLYPQRFQENSQNDEAHLSLLAANLDKIVHEIIYPFHA